MDDGALADRYVGLELPRLAWTLLSLIPSRIANLLRFLPSRRRFVFEFRDPSWLNDEVREILERGRIGI